MPSGANSSAKSRRKYTPWPWDNARRPRSIFSPCFGGNVGSAWHTRQSPFRGGVRHLRFNIWYFGGDRDHDILLTLYSDSDVLGIRALPPGITRHVLGHSSELIRLGSRSHVVDATLEVLKQATEGCSLWNYRGRPFVLPSQIAISLSVSPFDLWFCRGQSLASVSGIRLGGHVDVVIILKCRI